MRCFIFLGLLGLGTVAPSDAERISDSFRAQLPSLADMADEILFTQREQREKCKGYPEHGYKVGQMVKVNKAGAVWHNQVGIATCRPDTRGARGRVCLHRMGCWTPDHLRHTTPGDVALVTMAEVLSESARIVNILAARAKGKWPAVQANLALVRKTIATNFPAVWAQVNPCSEDVQVKFADAFASAKAQASILASWAVRQPSGVFDSLEDCVRSAGKVLGDLGRSGHDAVKTQADKLVATIKEELDLIKEMSKQKVSEIILAERLKAFAKGVAELAGHVAEGTLVALQDGVGRLLAVATSSFDSLHVDDIVLELADGVELYGEKAVAALSPCGEQAKLAAEQVYNFVGKVKRVRGAIAAEWPAVQQSILETADKMQRYVLDITDGYKTAAEAALKSDLVQEVLKKIEDLRNLAKDRSTELARKVRALTTEIQQQIRELGEPHDDKLG